ncbi:liver carboxylesterase 1 isoform X3 [Rhinopithecus roxellana]|uniref:liver carboxylesterase 1 isoform X3 n=1 Tax=Rhinopithecus roxellana TaxID=61622 RepID=UPI001237121B|nr:liver carboxylesterase 1 isoform X3 [Rhinopithecus roxellana]
MWLRALVLATLVAFTAWAGHPSSPPVVDTVHGKVLGKFVSLEGFAQPVAVFLGIPFAKPPLGPLRFTPPQPAEPWSFVKNATSYPPMCSQDAMAGQVLSELFTNRKENIPLKVSEDCLYLNIYTPADLTKKNRLPVMVWIHGGGLMVGAASTYDGQVLAAHENVVVVTIQYRLGIWGFFSTGDEHSRGNWGHLDQLAALHWVQDNIARFGGNPGSVTIFGESAGGESVSVLVLSPLAKNLFHRAISESGVALTAVLVKKDNVKPLAEQIAIVAGCQTTTSAVMVHCLRQKTEEELVETTLKMKFLSLDLHGDPRESHPFLGTVIDGVLLPKTPEELQAERKFNTVPYMVGFNKQEFGWIIPMLMDYPLSEGKLDQKTAMSLLWKSYPFVYIPKELIPEATEKYLGGTDDPVKKKDLFLDLLADVMFCVPSVIVARHHRDAGAPTFMYEFQYRPSFSSDMKPKTVIGDHGDEIFSVLGAPFLKEGASEEEIRLSKMVMKFWANFARNGNPNGEGLPRWPEYNQEEGYLQIGANTQAAQKLKDKEVAFWTKLFAKKAVETPPQTEHIEL